MCTNLEIARHSNCPSDAWKTSLAAIWVHDDMSFLNVGANKGYNILEFLLRHETTSKVPSMKKWHKWLMDKGVDQHACGVCRSCSSKVFPPATTTVGRVRRVKAVELLKNNYNVLTQMCAEHIPRVQVLHAAAVENHNTMAFEPPLKRRGHETIGVSKRGLSVSTITLDELVNASKWDMVSIDAEGFDGQIIRGGKQSILEKRIRVLEFEYSGKWTEKLSSTIRFLSSHGYWCFWTGNNGTLAPINANCSTINIRKWSNVACAHEEWIVNLFSRFS